MIKCEISYSTLENDVLLYFMYIMRCYNACIGQDAPVALSNIDGNGNVSLHTVPTNHETKNEYASSSNMITIILPSRQ